MKPTYSLALGVFALLWSASVHAGVTVYTDTFDTVSTGPTQGSVGAGGFYTDRYAPGTFKTSFFDGDNRLEIGVDAAGPSDGFERTQGRKVDTNPLTTPQSWQTISASIDLYVSADLFSHYTRVGMWATAVDESSIISSYPILEFHHTLDHTGWAWYDSNTGAWVYGPGMTVSDSDQWYNLAFELSGSNFNYSITDSANNTEWAGTSSSGGTYELRDVILQVVNFGQGAYSAYMDNLMITSVPEPTLALGGLLCIAGLAIRRRSR
jgi:hypothetical protein